MDGQDQRTQNSIKQLDEKILSTKDELEKKIKSMSVADVQIALCASQVKKIGEMMVRSKEEVTKDQSEMRKDFSKIQSEFTTAQKNLGSVVDDTKFWLDKFMKSFSD